MLNLLRSSKLELRQSYIEMLMAIGLAVCMAGALIFLEETDAQQELTQLESQMASNAAVHQPEVISEVEVSSAQIELTRLKSRVNYLTRRQTERDDWNDVQAILFANHGSQKGVLAELQSLKILHAHRPLNRSSPSEASLVEVKVKANLWSQATNSLVNPSAP